MQEFSSSFGLAFNLLIGLDADLLEIIGLSLHVSLIAVVIAAIIGFPLGASIAVMRFPGRQLVDILLNALMGLPPVVVGLLVYMMISRAGPLGWLNILYSPTAMIIAQIILIVPIVAALTRQLIEDLHREYDEQFRSLCLPMVRVIPALIWDARYSLLTVVLAGFGRAIAEVGAVIIVGGNINHLTRMMTTSIALETSKGNLALALALGLVLLLLSLSINAAVYALRASAKHLAYA
ncbi:MAG: ABC transporter permease subunit [Gammaproteobacteria bacterium]|nr:ABC transporter permease subunit [Gammaproteobacteria bacterium]